MKLFLVFNKKSGQGITTPDGPDARYVLNGVQTGFGVDSGCFEMRERIEEGELDVNDVVIKEVEVDL